MTFLREDSATKEPLRHYMSGKKYGVFSGLYFPVFRPNIGKYGPEKTPYLDTFHAVNS